MVIIQHEGSKFCQITWIFSTRWRTTREQLTRTPKILNDKYCLHLASQVDVMFALTVYPLPLSAQAVNASAKSSSCTTPLWIVIVLLEIRSVLALTTTWELHTTGLDFDTHRVTVLSVCNLGLLEMSNTGMRCCQQLSCTRNLPNFAQIVSVRKQASLLRSCCQRCRKPETVIKTYGCKFGGCKNYTEIN